MRVRAEAWLPTTVAPARLADAPFMAGLTETVSRATPEIFARQIGALLNRPDHRPHLGAIACRTLVMVGRQNSYSPLAVHDEIAAAIPGAELAVIEDAGQW